MRYSTFPSFGIFVDLLYALKWCHCVGIKVSVFLQAKQQNVIVLQPWIVAPHLTNIAGT